MDAASKDLRKDVSLPLVLLLGPERKRKIISISKQMACAQINNQIFNRILSFLDQSL